MGCDTLLNMQAGAGKLLKLMPLTCFSQGLVSLCTSNTSNILLGSK